MKKVLLPLLSLAALLALAPAAYAADAAAAKQPSTDRVISHADMKKTLETPDAVVILDLRRNSDYDKDTLTVPSARRFDPDKIAEWSSALSKDKEILLLGKGSLRRQRMPNGWNMRRKRYTQIVR